MNNNQPAIAESNYSMYEVFFVVDPETKRKRRYIFTDRSLIIGQDKEYLYSDMTAFRHERKPGSYTKGLVSMTYTDGLFTSTSDEKTIRVHYTYSDIKRFKKAMQYANRCICGRDVDFDHIVTVSNTQTTSPQSSARYVASDPIELPVWNPVIGSEKNFPLYGKTLVVPENMDAYNTYRKIFSEYARICTENAMQEYDTYVTDLPSFIANFVKIYDANLQPIAKRILDVCIIEGIWSASQDEIFNTCKNSSQKSMNHYQSISDAAKRALENNRNATAGLMSLVPNLSGGGFGLRGALTGIAKATAFNVVRDTIEASALNNTNVTPEQQAAIFSLAKRDIACRNFNTDFARSYTTLISILKKNGSDIWSPSASEMEQANNIFKNMENPNFPQDRIVDAMIAAIQVNPYNTEYYRFLADKFGDTEELQTIVEYFG